MNQLNVVMLFRFVLLFAIGISTLVSGVQFPNDILGEPAVQCGQGTIHLSVNTSKDVPSRIFAKGHYDLDGCFFESAKQASFDFGKCNMNRQREINPRGMAYTLTVVVQLHPLFITKVDRAYHIRCFYMEADKAVSINLGVSEMATEVLESAHAMPQCMYGLHSEGPNGPMARFARVGDKLWHVWDCPSDVYGMLVHSCFVLDGQSNKVLIVDENGCGVDDYVMQTPQYSSDMTRAQQETHVFKFADRITVAFNCQIRLCFINDDACKGVTPPNCNASGRRPTAIGNSPSNSGGQNSSNIIPSSSNNNTSSSEASTSTLPSVTLAENVTASGTPPTVISEVPGNKSAGGLDDDLTSDELITTTTQASSTLPIGVTTTNSIATNLPADSSTTTAGITVETNSGTTSGFLATDLNELIGILTTVQPDNDTFPTPGDLKAFARKSDFDPRTLTTTEPETEKPPSALERLEKVEPEGSGEETQRPIAGVETHRPTDDPATLTIDPALIADADQLLLEPRGRRNVVKPRLHDIPIVSGRDVLDLDINSELTVLERDDAPPSAFSGDRRAAAQQFEQSPTDIAADRPNVCISALGFALLITTALFSVIVCATAIFIGAIRTRKGAKITELIRSVDVRPMSF